MRTLVRRDTPIALRTSLATAVVENEVAVFPRMRDAQPRYVLGGADAGRWLRSLRFSYRRMAWLVRTHSPHILKRALDISFSATLLWLLWPIFFVVGLLVKLRDGGPVLHWQTRVGKNGREFAFPKFRTMVPEAERLRCELDAQNQHREGVTFKIRRDPRVTPIGAFLRKTSIDELPQLWNVLRGDMSLVGPRPPLPHEVEQYTLQDRRRLSVTPGLTCLWQVSGRSDLPFSKQVALDLYYIEHQSVWLDLKILALTIPAVITCRGAY